MEITSFVLNNFAPEIFFFGGGGGGKFVTMNTRQKLQECRFRLHDESVLWRTQLAHWLLELFAKIAVLDILWFLGWISTKLALIWSKMPLQHNS